MEGSSYKGLWVGFEVDRSLELEIGILKFCAETNQDCLFESCPGGGEMFQGIKIGFSSFKNKGTRYFGTIGECRELNGNRG